MISYAELEFAIARWKARMSGVPQEAEPVASGTVEAEVPVSTAPEEPATEGSGTVTDEGGEYASGNIDLSDN
jgi:hypothetical protein